MLNLCHKDVASSTCLLSPLLIRIFIPPCLSWSLGVEHNIKYSHPLSDKQQCLKSFWALRLQLDRHCDHKHVGSKVNPTKLKDMCYPPSKHAKYFVVNCTELDGTFPRVDVLRFMLHRSQTEQPKCSLLNPPLPQTIPIRNPHTM